MKRVQSMKMKLFAGRVDVSLDVVGASHCSISLSSPDEAFFALPSSRRRLAARWVVRGNTYTLTVRCAKARVRSASPLGKAFSLSITAAYQS